MLNTIIYLASLVFLVDGAASAFAQTQRFEYRVNFYPVSSEQCPDAARSVGEKFSQMTGLTVLQTSCQSRVIRTLDLVIAYEAETPVKVVSTFDEYGHEQGFYPTLASCTANFQTEMQKFQEYTGLPVLAAYCYTLSEIRGDYENPYVLRIESVGVPRLKPINFERTIYAKPLEPGPQIAERIRQASAAKGFTWPRVLVDYSGSLNRVMLRYYGARPKPIAFLQYTAYETPEECYARIPEVKSVLTAANAEPMTMFCAQKEFWGSTLLYTLAYVQGTYDDKKQDNNYGTMAACDVDKSRVMGWYRESQGLDVAGAVCSYEQGDILQPRGVYMHVFIRT